MHDLNVAESPRSRDAIGLRLAVFVLYICRGATNNERIVLILQNSMNKSWM